jgi:hypothetical protein
MGVLSRKAVSGQPPVYRQLGAGLGSVRLCLAAASISLVWNDAKRLDLRTLVTLPNSHGANAATPGSSRRL